MSSTQSSVKSSAQSSVQSSPEAIGQKASSPTSEQAIERDRYELSMVFRLAEKFGLHEGICNHFSTRLDTPEERYLINPYGLHWSEMTPEKLLLIDGEGTVYDGEGEVEDTARFIHVAGHRANSRHKTILHTHMPYATALTMLQDGRLEMAHQTATRFYARTDYVDKFGGLALSAEEGERIAQNSQANAEIDVTFLANHGVVVGGPTVAHAFDDLYYLERACRQQVIAMQSGGKLKIIDDDTVKTTSEQIHGDLIKFSQQHFDALCRVLENNPQHNFVF